MKRVLAVLLLLAMVLAGCTSDGSQSDADGDTMPKGAERAGWLVTVDLMDRRIQYEVTSDPDVFDTDGDGVSDYDEFIRGLDPRKNDTDEDGLWDCQEVFHTNLTECLDPDFHDEDGGTGTDPLRADSDPGRGRYALQYLSFQDLVGDLVDGIPRTGDGLSDGQEWNGIEISLPGDRTRTVTLDPRKGDTDGDFLDDGAEVLLFGTDPTITDTDGDGCQDGQDVHPAAIDRYQAGFQSLTLKRDFGGGGDILLRAHTADNSMFYPGQGETQHYTVGQETALGDTDPTSVRTTFCNYSPWDPWATFEVVAFHREGEQAIPLDLGQSALPEGRLWWNLREDTLALEREGEAIDRPITLDGPDGRLVFDPVLVLA